MDFPVLSRRNFWIFVSIAMLCINVIKGCHNAKKICDHADKHEKQRCERERGRRSAPFNTEIFMANCMQKKMPSVQGYMRSLVDFMVYHTTWYHLTDSMYCVSDTVECWQRLTSFIMKWDSMYMVPTKTCMWDLGGAVAIGSKIFQSLSDAKLFMPTSKLHDIKKGDFINLLRADLPRLPHYDRSFNDLDYLLDFFINDFVCSDGFCDCTGLNLDIFDGCGDHWLTRIVGSIKLNSELRAPMVKIANTAIANVQSKNGRGASSFFVQPNQLNNLWQDNNGNTGTNFFGNSNPGQGRANRGSNINANNNNNILGDTGNDGTGPSWPGNVAASGSNSGGGSNAQVPTGGIWDNAGFNTDGDANNPSHAGNFDFGTTGGDSGNLGVDNGGSSDSSNNFWFDDSNNNLYDGSQTFGDYTSFDNSNSEFNTEDYGFGDSSSAPIWL